MEELTKAQVDWKKITIVGFLVLLTGLVFAGSTWYVADQFHRDELEVKNNEIADLTTELNQEKSPENKDGAESDDTDLDKEWKTYEDGALGISFSYPSTGYKVKKTTTAEAPMVKLVKTEEDTSSGYPGEYWLTVYDAKNYTSIPQWLTGEKDIHGYNIKPGSVKEVSNKGLFEYSFVDEGMSEYFALAYLKNRKVYILNTLSVKQNNVYLKAVESFKLK